MLFVNLTIIWHLLEIDMFFVLSKTLDFLASPIVWVVGLMIFALFRKPSKLQKKGLRWALILLIILSNPYLINLLLLAWEVPPTPLKDLQKKYTVGVVLTGITQAKKSPKDRVYFATGADRIFHALMLYRKGYIKKILITGGTVSVTGQVEISEAQRLLQVLLLAQVPREDIILEEKARNTRENAQLSQKILEDKFPNQDILLITSGFHMRRALGCFRKVGLNPEPFSAGFFSQDTNYFGFYSLIPSEKAIYRWYILSHEILGYVVYKLIGYIP